MIKTTARVKGVMRPSGYVTIVCQLNPEQIKALQVFKGEEFNLTIDRAQIPMFEEEVTHGTQ